MNANELSNQLRNGNYINYIGNPIKCSIETIYAVSKCVGETAMYQPIHPTEEMIYKFGYKKGYGIYYQRNGKRSIVFENNEFRMFVSDFDTIKLESIHQMQNLFFALEGVELVFSTEP